MSHTSSTAKYNSVDDALLGILRDIEQDGVGTPSRNGDTLELTHHTIHLAKPWRREIMLKHRKANVAAQIAETMWVLAGRDDMAFLTNYLPRAKDYSDDGVTWSGAYGMRLRDFGHYYGLGTDQLREVYDLLSNDINSRQAVMTIWDPNLDFEETKDHPCNDLLHFLHRNGKLDLHVYVRSNDVIWGWSGINQFEWSTLLEIMAALLDVKVGGLHFSVGSLHLYSHHYDRSNVILNEYDDRKINEYDLSTFRDSARFEVLSEPLLTRFNAFDHLLELWFQLEDKIRNAEPGTPLLGYIMEMPEQMFRSWLHVIAWYWTGDEEYLRNLKGSRMYEACAVSVGPFKKPHDWMLAPNDVQGASVETFATRHKSFLEQVFALHAEKHAAYGDSWKRRGEALGILANIARKVDRLGGAETSDESQIDTAIDLMVYLAKYQAWLEDFKITQWSPNVTVTTPSLSDGVERPNEIIAHFEAEASVEFAEREQQLREDFDVLSDLVLNREPSAERDRLRNVTLTRMLSGAHALAYNRWFLHETETQAALAERDNALTNMPVINARFATD